MLETFHKRPETPENIPLEMMQVVISLCASKTQEECLEKAYAVMTNKYRGNRIKTYTRLWRIFKTDISELWRREGFIHCTNANYLMRMLLLQSKFFKKEDIQSRWTLTWYISPHQYLEVTMKSGEKVAVDVWSAAYGLKLGEYAGGFN